MFFDSVLNEDVPMLHHHTPSQPHLQLLSRIPAAHTDQQRTLMTLRLPPELWFLILRFATYPPFSWSLSSPSDHQNRTTIPFHIRLSNYNSEIKWKASLTHLCKDWNLWGQQFLWEDIWIASGRDGRVLAGIVHQGRRQQLAKAKGKEKGKRSDPPFRGNITTFIKKLHIETPSMDRCCSFDLTSILQQCERLEVFIDLRSVRKAFGVVGGGTRKDSTTREKTWELMREPVSIHQGHLFPPPPPSRIPDPILQALLRPTSQKPTLKHLTFTNYDYDSDNFRGGVWFWEGIGKVLIGGGENGGSLAATLESLEAVMSTSGVGMGRRLDDYGYGYGYAQRNLASNGLLTSLEIDIKSINPSWSLSLPSLHSLRIPLTTPTLLVISTWSLPALQSLSAVSIDFTGWRRRGFHKFMHVHGGGLVKFEIVGGGESGEEEGWITEREDAVYGIERFLHLPSTSPKLKHFICSSNASEWNWETPDWIAPHVLMPEHFGVERIGIWGLEGKVVVRDDWDLGVGYRRTISTWTTSRSNRHSITPHDSSSSIQRLEEQPFFMLQEQFASLLRQEAFPSLVSIRDMSLESDLIRRSVGIGSGLASSKKNTTVDPLPNMNRTKKKASFKETVASRFASFTAKSRSDSGSSSASSLTSPTTSTSSHITQSHKIRTFWLEVLEMCDRRGVYLEDWKGRRIVP